MKSWRWTWPALPYTRLELPGWGRLLRGLGFFDQARWADAPARAIRGKAHGYAMTLDLRDWSQRMTYFLGRYHDLALQEFIRAAVAPGDTFVDVGANIGMVTLSAARAVGPQGRVIAVEPNPQALRRLRLHVADNRLDQVEIHGVGLSDRPGEGTLIAPLHDSGKAGFAQDVDLSPRDACRHRVELVPGDALLPADPAGPACIKIDVEGYECRVLRGMAATLTRLRPAVVTETIAGHLERAGSSLDELFALMRGHGYEPFALEVPRRVFRRRLVLRPVRDVAALKADEVAWLEPGGIHRRRLARWISPR